MVGDLGWRGPQPGTGEDTAQVGNGGAQHRRLPIDGSGLDWQADRKGRKGCRGHGHMAASFARLRLGVWLFAKSHGGDVF